MRPRTWIALAAALAVAGLVVVTTDRGPVDKGSLVLVGDSLNLGTEPYLREVLEHWSIRADDVVGRPTADGLAALAGMGAAPGPLVVSLGTNDDPGDPAAFRARTNELLDRAGATRCVIWATLWRDNAPESSFNAVLSEIARERPNVRLLDWAEMLRLHPEWVAADGTHGSPDGYRARAEEVARLARACPPATT